MLILLPPSETKAPGGTGPALELAALPWPELTPTRARLLDTLADLAADLPAARAALNVTAAKDPEIAANLTLRSAPTMPALDRYTGVLYDALDARSLTRAQRGRADGRLVIASALFGAVRATDAIPAYRLSAGSHLPALGTLASLWRPHLGAALASEGEPILDLRSGAYLNLGPIPGAITVRVATEQPDGSRIVVSHFNKATKGRLARAVATRPRESATIRDVMRAAAAAGLTVERTGDAALEIVT